MPAEIKCSELDRVRQRAIAIAGQASGICLLVAMSCCPQISRQFMGRTLQQSPGGSNPAATVEFDGARGHHIDCRLGCGDKSSLVTLGDSLPPTLSPQRLEVELRTAGPGVF